MTINEAKLREAITSNRLGESDIRRLLVNERNNAETVAMPTLGVDLATRNAESATAAKLEQAAKDATEHNIPLLLRVMAEHQMSTELRRCTGCQRWHAAGRDTCNTCFEPEEY